MALSPTRNFWCRLTTAARTDSHSQAHCIDSSTPRSILGVDKDKYNILMDMSVSSTSTCRRLRSSRPSHNGKLRGEKGEPLRGPDESVTCFIALARSSGVITDGPASRVAAVGTVPAGEAVAAMHPTRSRSHSRSLNAPAFHNDPRSLRTRWRHRVLKLRTGLRCAA